MFARAAIGWHRRIEGATEHETLCVLTLFRCRGGAVGEVQPRRGEYGEGGDEQDLPGKPIELAGKRGLGGSGQSYPSMRS